MFPRLCNIAANTFQLIGSYAPFTGGDQNRLNSDWQPTNVSGDAALDQNGDLLDRRMRDLLRNDSAVISLQRTLVDNLISTGVITNAMVKSDDDPEQFNDVFNHASDDEWAWWCENEADQAGELTWEDMQRQLCHELLETGVALMLECHNPDPDRSSPLCYQVLEKEQIDLQKDQLQGENQNEIKRGIEYDSRGQKVAFWLFDSHPGDTHASLSDSQRTDAKRVTYVTLPGRPSETGGKSYFASITQNARDLDDYLGSELTAGRIGSMMTVVHKSDKHTGSGTGFNGDGSSSSADPSGNPLLKLGRGTVARIGKDDDIAMVDPSRPNGNAKSFVDLIMRLLGMGGGVSPTLFTRDYSGTTYISAKAAGLADKRSFRPLQAYFARRVCMPVRRRWTERTILANGLGGVTPEQFDKRRRHWLAAEYQTPSWEMLDEGKETDAALDRIDGGLSTRKDEAARINKNWRAIDRQRARERRNEADLDLEYGISRIGTPAKQDDDDDFDADTVEKKKKEDAAA